MERERERERERESFFPDKLETVEQVVQPLSEKTLNLVNKFRVTARQVPDNLR